MITHVAIRFRDRIWSLPKPNRHHHVIRMIVRELGVATVDALGEDQGFLNEKGVYLTRWQALHHAVKCGQVPASSVDELFSEDVW